MHDIITRREDASSGFDPERRTVLIAGTIKDAPDVVIGNSGDRWRFLIQLRKVTRLITASGYEPNLQTGESSVSYPYGKSITRNGIAVPEGPTPESLWFDGPYPAFEALDLGMSVQQREEEWPGSELVFVEHNVPRRNRNGDTYPVRKRYPEGQSPDANDPANLEKDSRGYEYNANGVFEYQRDSDGNINMKDGRPLFVMEGIGMWDGVLLPLGHGIEGAILTEAGASALSQLEDSDLGEINIPANLDVVDNESANEAAQRLFDKHGGNTGDFRESAMKHPAIINASQNLKNDIMLGEYTP